MSALSAPGSAFLGDITALVLTFNESANIGRTLSKLKLFNKVLVVDSFSTDETLAIASGYPNVSIIQRVFDSFAGQCNFGLKQIETPWVLSLDADYVVADALVVEMQELDPGPDIAGYSVPFAYCVYGRRLRSSLYPSRTVLYRCDRAKYRDEGHGHRVTVGGKVLSLQNKIEHDDRKPLARWLRSQDRYMVIESKHLLATPSDHLKFPDRLRKRVLFAAPAIFVYLLFGRGLILDGWPGWFYVLQRTLAETLLSLRLLTARYELEKTRDDKSTKG
jgi:glycosyltransferase involved in cell wall biosynthesis